MSQSYILVVDDEEILRETYVTIIEAICGGEVVAATSGNEAVEILKQRGAPRLVVSDYRMPNGDGAFLGAYCSSNYPNVPFVVCSGSPEDEVRAVIPRAAAILLKPSIYKPLQDILKNLESAEAPTTATAAAPETFASFRLSLFVRLALLRYDLYLQLGAEKFVKIAREGEIFSAEDAAKLLSKKVDRVYLKSTDVASFLADLQSAVALLSPANAPLGSPLASVGLEIVEASQNLARELGWSNEVVDLAKRGAAMALQFAAGEPELARVLEARLKDPNSRYGEHVADLILITAYLAKAVGWESDFTLAKLSLASLLHDASLNEASYDRHFEHNMRAADPSNREPDIIVFREHPLRSAEFIQKLSNMPADLDQIILQHHEAPDERGYPSGLGHLKIAPLAALFIVAQDLEYHLAAAPSPADGVEAFLNARSAHYTHGNFRKIFAALAAQPAPRA